MIGNGVDNTFGCCFLSLRKFLSEEIDALFFSPTLSPEFTGILDFRVLWRSLHEDNTFTKWQRGKNKTKQGWLVNPVRHVGCVGRARAERPLSPLQTRTIEGGFEAERTRRV